MNFTASSPTNRETYDIPVNVCSSLQDLLDSAADKPDLQYRSFSNITVSNVTTTLPMHFSWHDINAHVNEGRRNKIWSCCREPDVEMYKFRKKQVLNSVFGAAHPGKVLAIMGASGAGKTSLLNILAQRNTGALEVRGSMKVNGSRVDRMFMKKFSAYVQQDDCFIGSLTVEEHLLFNAKLRMGNRYPEIVQAKRVRQVMRDVGLFTANSVCCFQSVLSRQFQLGLKGSANSLIGTRTRKGLSGGEKKRLAFASEVSSVHCLCRCQFQFAFAVLLTSSRIRFKILTSPPILLCDEPTSGLDSFLAFQVVTREPKSSLFGGQVLKKLAEKKGMTILLTIHQPSSQVFELFDRIYLMAEGRVAFCGSQTEAVDFWTQMGNPLPCNFNPSDHYISTLAIREKKSRQRQRDAVMAFCDEFARSPTGQAAMVEASSRTGGSRESSENSSSSWESGENYSKTHYASGWCQQLSALHWRNTKTILREPTLLKVQLVQSIIIAILTGIFYLGNTISQEQVMNINGSLFQMVTNMAFMFQFSVVNHFCLEMNTFHREHSSGLYRVSTYFLAKNLAELPNYTLSAIIFASILYWMSQMIPLWSAFLFYVMIAILVQNTAISIGSFSSTTCFLENLTFVGAASVADSLITDSSFLFLQNINTSLIEGYAFGCIFGNVAVAVAVMPIFVVPLLAFGVDERSVNGTPQTTLKVFAFYAKNPTYESRTWLLRLGFYINQSSLPIYFVPFRFISYFGYAYESLAINEWSHIDSIPGCTHNTNTSCYNSGTTVIRSLSFSPENMWINVGIILGMIVLIRFIAFLGLYTRAQLKK
uniref:ABC transporter domain-containing protein n=1 Tax=Heterorhabditis bacteriophora TaxID=37862 RepID=A0A1I7XU17_HETBA